MKESIEIKVVEGGEDLYITPIAYYKDNSKNKVLFYQCPEFLPKENEFAINSFSPSDNWHLFRANKLRVWWSLSFGRLASAISRTNQHCWKLKNWLWIFRFHLECDVLLAGIDMFDRNIRVRGQLLVNSEWTDDCYLNPSQKYLRKRMDEWIERASAHLHLLEQAEKDEWTEESSLRSDVQLLVEYLEWEKHWKARGCEIGFVCSLDT